MKYTLKKTLAFLLTMVMLVNVFPLSAFAGTDQGEDTGSLDLPEPHTINVQFDPTIDSLPEKLFVVLKQESVPLPSSLSWYTAASSSDQYYGYRIQSTSSASTTASTFKMLLQNAGDENSPYSEIFLFIYIK